MCSARVVRFAEYHSSSATLGGGGRGEGGEGERGRGGEGERGRGGGGGGGGGEEERGGVRGEERW